MMNEPVAVPIRAGSVLAALKALSNKKGDPSGSAAADQAADPALAGAKRNKSSVTLGMDPPAAADAAVCARLKKAVDDATAEFATMQARLRDYGREKRERYNDLFKATVTTVEVPYLDGEDVKVVQVICSHKYSVAQDTILGVKSDLGDHYDRLFKEDRIKALKPNAEELLVSLFEELGLTEDARENAMNLLFEENVKVSASETYEVDVKKVPADMRKVLNQAVTRASPGLKFPGLGS